MWRYPRARVWLKVCLTPPFRNTNLCQCRRSRELEKRGREERYTKTDTRKTSDYSFWTIGTKKSVFFYLSSTIFILKAFYIFQMYSFLGGSDTQEVSWNAPVRAFHPPPPKILEAISHKNIVSWSTITYAHAMVQSWRTHCSVTEKYEQCTANQHGPHFVLALNL